MTRADIPNLPPLRDVIAEHGLSALKSLGQNFLLDLNLTGRIARTAGDLSNTIVFEVGPGPGGLTRALLAEGAKRVIAVEQDRRCIGALQTLADACPNRLAVIEGDALKADEPNLIGDTEGADIKIIANLPYNIGTALLVKWLKVTEWRPWYKSLTLMFQKEVGQRIVAAPKTRAYGRLSVISQFRCRPRIAFDVPPRAFIPQPKVTSCIVHLEPVDTPADAPALKTLETVTNAAFGQRRKMLRASLKSLGVNAQLLLAAAGIEETRRAEELSVEEFCHLSNTFETLRKTS